MTRTILFDLDGTLVDSVPDLAAALNRMLARRALAPFSHVSVASFVGDGVPVLVERAFAARGRMADRDAVAEFAADYAARASEASLPYPGVVDTLTTLRLGGWRMAVCTNKPEQAAHALLAALDLGEFFVAVGGGDSFPVRKPDPAHLGATLRAASGDPARALMVGDHHNDVRAARGLGIPAIFAAWGYSPPQAATGAAAVAHAFAELPELAEALLPERPCTA